MVTRALPKERVSPAWAGSGRTPSFWEGGEDESGHQCWTLGKGRWQAPYLVVDLDAAVPEGGGPIACHKMVSRGLLWGLLQLPGHCGDGGDMISTSALSAFLPPCPEHSCSAKPGP